MLRFRLALPLVCCAVASSFLAAQSSTLVALRRSALSHQRRPAPPESPLRATAFARRQAGALHRHACHRRRCRKPSLDRFSLRQPAPTSPANSPSRRPPTSAESTTRSGRPTAPPVFFLAKRGEHTQLFRLDLRGGEASPYDLKILPRSMSRKTKTPSIRRPRPSPMKRKTTRSQQTQNRTARPSTSPASPSATTANTSRSGHTIPKPQARRNRKTPKSMPPGSTTRSTSRASISPRSSPTAPSTAHSKRSTFRLTFTAPSGRLSPTSSSSSPRRPTMPPTSAPPAAAWIVDAAAPAKPTKLDSVPATVSGGAWNADGTSIVFAAATPEDAPPGYDDLYLLATAIGGCKAA